MSHAEKQVIDDLAELPLFSPAVYERPPLKVLIINDSDTDIGLFRSTLETISVETFELSIAEDAKFGLGQIGSGRFDIAFVGDSVGSESGIELIAKAGGRLCPTPMVLLSNNSDPGREEFCLKAGAVDIIDRRELSPALLRRVIRYARFNHDTTRRLIVNERRYRELAENASQASGEKSKFLANMSHELRTPLNAILGFSEAIQHELFGALEGDGAGKYGEYIGHIFTSGSHLLSLINDLLDLSKIEAGKFDIFPSNIRLIDVANDVAKMTTPQAEAAGVTLVVEMADPTMEIYADGRLITQAILNVVANAVKFSPSGARVVLKTETEGHNIILSVTDQGCGISEDELRHVLEPFRQVSDLETRPERGTGLGLPLAQSIVELHQGGLEIASEPGVGTVVSIWMPRNVRRLETAKFIG
jgi:signal transduction histidine kinase